jgi:hypothetical protein
MTIQIQMFKYQNYSSLLLFRVLSLIWHLSFVICHCYLPCPSQLTLIGGIVKCQQAGSIILNLEDAYPTKVYFEFGKAVQRQI